MTQFQSPPPPPQPSYPVYGAYEMQAPPRWSGAAIAGFICSILGFFGITALMGIVLGIVGIVSTSGGRKRGMGLAIAAIPISLVTGAICGFLILGVVMVGKVMQMPALVKSAMAFDSGDLKAATDSMRNICTASLDAAVTPEQMEGWFKKIKAEHGTLTTLQFNQATQRPQSLPGGGFQLDMEGKFVNGSAPVEIIMRMDGGFHLKIDDITVGKSSLRGAAAKPPGE